MRVVAFFVLSLFLLPVCHATARNRDGQVIFNAAKNSSGATRTQVQLHAALTPEDTPVTRPAAGRQASNKIVFVCDATGSMLYKWNSLRGEVEGAVARLVPEQLFGVMFFTDRMPRKYKWLNNHLQPATSGNKQKADQFLSKEEPWGETDPIPALRATFELRPDVIYLFTDGDFPDPKAVLDCIHELNAEHRIRINTVGFTAPKDDAAETTALLKQIAKENGGTYHQVKVSSPPPDVDQK